MEFDLRKSRHSTKNDVYITLLTSDMPLHIARTPLERVVSVCRCVVVDRLSFLQHNNRTTLYKHFKGLKALHLCRLNTSLSSFNTLSHLSIDFFSLFSLSCRTDMVSIVTFCFMKVGQPSFTSLHPSVRAQSLGEEVNKQCNRASSPAGP